MKENKNVAETVIRPGDKVILSSDKVWRPKEVDHLLNAWNERFPDVDALLVCGVEVTVVSGRRLYETRKLGNRK